MNEYHLRVNEFDGYYDTLVKLFDDDIFTWVLMVHHRGKKKENPHFHAVFRTDKVEDDLRKLFKANLTQAKGNKNYSLRVTDENEKVKSYLFHEESPVEYSKGVPSEEIEYYQVKNQEVQKELKENTPNKVIDSVVQKLTDWHKEKRVPPHTLCFRLIMEELISRGDWIPNKFQVERWINKVRAIFASRSESNKRDFIRTLYGEWYPQYADYPDWQSGQTKSVVPNFRFSENPDV